MFREVLHRDPGDADAYAGMGEAALALGNFRTARADFLQANGLRPGDATFAARLALADTVLALDPTARGVGPAERVERSRALLARTLRVVAACSRQPLALADSARRLLTSNANLGARRAGNEGADEALIGLAGELWARRSPSCDTNDPDEALRLVQLRLAQ